MKKPRMLIADDDKAFLYLLKVRFRLLGYDVMTATNGEDALSLACGEPPDLLILDINMPGRGFKVHRCTRSIGSLRLVPVIYVTGEASEGPLGLAKRLGAFAIIKKPVDFWQLAETAQSALDPKAVQGLAESPSTGLTGDAGMQIDTTRGFHAN